MKKIVKVKGMHCASCEILLTEALEESGVKVFSANHKKGEMIVELNDEGKMAVVKKAVEKEGYSLA